MALVAAENGDRAEAEEAQKEGLVRHGVLDAEELDFLDVLAEEAGDDADALRGDDVFDGVEMKIGDGDLRRGRRAPRCRRGSRLHMCESARKQDDHQRDEQDERPEDVDAEVEDLRGMAAPQFLLRRERGRRRRSGRQRRLCAARKSRGRPSSGPSRSRRRARPSRRRSSLPGEHERAGLVEAVGPELLAVFVDQEGHGEEASEEGFVP